MDRDFKLRRNEYGDILGCDGCGEEAPLAETSGGYPEKKFEFCGLCYSSFIGNAKMYPNQYDYVTPVMLAQTAHWLLREMRKNAPTTEGEK